MDNANDKPSEPYMVVKSPSCSSCLSNNTRIYGASGAVRYVRCRYCGHTFSFSPRIEVQRPLK